MNNFQKYQGCLENHQPQLALQHLLQHLYINRQHAGGYFLAGNLFRELNRYDLAINAYLEACRLNPNRSQYYLNLGVTYREMQQPEKAIGAYETAYKLNPDPAILSNRASAMLLAGNYTDGWREYEWRTQTPSGKPKYDWYPADVRWNGEPLNGQTIVVYGDQGGIGDDIQFCRYLPYLKAMGAIVIFATWKSLIPIVSTMEGVDLVMEHCWPSYKNLDVNWVVPLMSLPAIFKTTLETVPSRTPYLSVPAERRAKWQELLSQYPASPGIKKVGFVYATSHDKARTCPLDQWSPLLSQPGIQWFSLQKEDDAGDGKRLAAENPNIIDLTHHLNDFADTAALIESLDLLISIDTSVPHLAGALAKKTWLLLPFNTDFRWLLHRDDSPWYPSFRLFRQSTLGQWEPVIEQVRAELLKI